MTKGRITVSAERIIIVLGVCMAALPPAAGLMQRLQTHFIQ